MTDWKEQIKEILKFDQGNVLIVTGTENSVEEIKNKFLELNKYIPNNVTIQDWFSFLLEHGVHPYQGVIFPEEIRILGIKIVNNNISNMGDNSTDSYYLNEENDIYSDKISKFVLECNKKSNGAVIKRLANIYQYIFIDGSVELGGDDLEIVKMLKLKNFKVVVEGEQLVEDNFND